MPVRALAERPLLPPDLRLVQEAYDFLCLSRPPGFAGPGAIPLAEIMAYAAAFPLSMPLPDFVELIRMIDARHLSYLQTKQETTDGRHKNTRRSH